MSITVTFGWWLVPLLLTVGLLAWAIPMRADECPTGSMFDGIGYVIGAGFRVAAALIVSLIAWLIWSLLA